MNKILFFFLAPITAFFLPQVYRDALKSSGRKGLLYVVYWAFLTTIFATMTFASRLTISDAFMQWVKKEIPVLIWTPEGLSFENNQKIARLDHPVYGPIAVFDMTRTTVSGKELEPIYFFVTSKRIYFNKPIGPAEERDITRAGISSQKKLPLRVRVTGEMIQNFYRKSILAFMLMTPPAIFFVSLLIILISNSIYSLAGLLLNIMRKNKLSYGPIFSLTCFATGITLTLICLRTFIPLLTWPWPPAIDFLLALIYMSAAFIFTDKTTP
jgi:hypothetical protein